MVPSRFSDVLRGPTVRTELLADDGTYPNNERLPVVVHEGPVLEHWLGPGAE